MKPYGHTRTDHRTCDYGCCTFDGVKGKRCRKTFDRNRRKTARRVKLTETGVLDTELNVD